MSDSTRRSIIGAAPNACIDFGRAGLSQYSPIGRRIVAIVGEKIIVELDEDVQRDATVRRQHIVIGLFEHELEFVERQPFAEQFVANAIDVNESFQFLKSSQKPQRSISTAHAWHGR